MRLRRKKHAPPPSVGPRRLPSLGGQAGDQSGVGGETGAFRAVLRGLSPQEVQKAANGDTMPLPDEKLAARLAEVAKQQRRRTTRRRLVAIVVSLLLLLGIGGPVLSADMGVQAFSLGTGQGAAPSMPHMAASNSGMMQIDLPAAVSTTSMPSKPMPVAPTPTPIPPTPTPPSAPPPGPYSTGTPPPGYSSFAMTEPSPDPWAGSWGQCTWWAAYKRSDEDFSGFGDAWNWANAAQARGYTVTTTPAANATVVFAPGVEGASGLGHVSHVEQVLTDGWVLVSEMNFYWNGGGFARVDYRYVYAGNGVWFIH